MASAVRPRPELFENPRHLTDGRVIGRPSFNLLQNFRCVRIHVGVLSLRPADPCRRRAVQRNLETRRTLLRMRVMPRLAEPIRFSESIQAFAAELI